VLDAERCVAELFGMMAASRAAPAPMPMPALEAGRRRHDAVEAKLGAAPAARAEPAAKSETGLKLS
jgi:hypothetical protein